VNRLNIKYFRPLEIGNFHICKLFTTHCVRILDEYNKTYYSYTRTVSVYTEVRQRERVKVVRTWVERLVGVFHERVVISESQGSWGRSTYSEHRKSLMQVIFRISPWTRNLCHKFQKLVSSELRPSCGLHTFPVKPVSTQAYMYMTLPTYWEVLLYKA